MRVRLPRKSTAALDISCDSQLVAVGGEKLVLIELGEDVLASGVPGSPSNQSCVKFSNVDAERLAYSVGGRVFVADVRGGEAGGAHSSFDTGRKVGDLSFNYFDASCLGVSSAGNHYLYDTRSMSRIASLSSGASASRGGCLSFHPLDRNVISTSLGSSVSIYDIRRARKPLSSWVAHSHDINSIHWTSRNGGQLVTGSQAAASIWKMQGDTFRESRSVRTSTQVLEAQCAPFGDTLAVLSWQDPVVRLYNVNQPSDEPPLVALFPPLDTCMQSVVRAFCFRRDPFTLNQQVVTLHDGGCMFWDISGDVLLACRNHRTIEKLMRRGSIPTSPRRQLSVSSVLKAEEAQNPPPQQKQQPSLPLLEVAMPAREELSVLSRVSFACVQVCDISLETMECAVVLSGEDVVRMEFKVRFPSYYPHSASAHVDLVSDPLEELPAGIGSALEYLKIFRALVEHHSKRRSNCMLPTCSTLNARLVKQMAALAHSQELPAIEPPTVSPVPVVAALSVSPQLAQSVSPFRKASVANLLRESVSDLGGGVSLVSMSNVISNGVIAALSKLLPPRLGYGARFDMRFSSILDGTSLRVLFKKMESAGDHWLMVVETVDGHVFGAYASSRLRPSNNYFGTSEMFLFRITSSGELEHHYARGNSNYMFTGPRGTTVAFGCESFALCFTNTLDEGTTDYCETYQCEPLCEPPNFMTRCVEVFSIDDGLEGF